MRLLTVILSSLCFLVTVLPLIQTDVWWIRIWDFPRLQIAVLCLISIVLLFIYFNCKKISSRILLSLAAGAFLYQVSLIIVFTPLFPFEAPGNKNKGGKNSFTILQSNVKMCNREAERFRQLVYEYNPDIVSVNEPDAWWADQLAELDRIYPYSVKKPLPNTYGMILYSKFPFKDEEINFLVNENVPSFFITIVLPSGSEFFLHCVHPKPPRPGTSTYKRDTELLLIGSRIQKEQKPAIVVGDLNDVAWSYTTNLFKEVSGVVDPRQGRGFYNTFNVQTPLLRYPLDHFLYTPHFTLNSLEKLQGIGSDHFPMFISLHLENN